MKNNIEFEIKQSNSTYSRWWLNQLHKIKPGSARHTDLINNIEKELANLSIRRQLIAATKINYPLELPVSGEVATIKDMLAKNQVIIVSGETGSGKTTQLPKVMLECGYGNNGLIGHTQPRRIAAKSLASRISEELGCKDSQHNLVGYKMRFHDRTSTATTIKLMTDGILLQEIQTDRLLLQYSALIIDEVHERSLNIDFILGYLRELLPRRPDLKIIITSATSENDKLSKFLHDAPILNVSGKTYPVDIIYQPRGEEDDDADLNSAIYSSICAALEVERGNGLVFLPGEHEIKTCLAFLRKTELKHYELLPLYSRQNNEEQSRIFAANGRIKIILATNIAETSLTIPGIRFVIDLGVARVKRYSLRNRVEQLQIENISQASSRQRAGRAGRVSHGLCVRLFSESDFNLRRQFTEPELLRSNLANVILKMLSLNLGDPDKFQFLDKPEMKHFNDGFRTLYQVQALDEDNRITPLGRKLAQIPIDVQLGRILLAAGEKFACLNEGLIIVAFLAIQDPREFPLEQQQLTKERHALWADKQSDFIQILNLWRWYHEQLIHKKSNKKLLEICHKQFVSLLRLREWHELHRQLKEILLGMGYRENSKPADYERLHRAILSGFVVNIGQKDLVENYYLGVNGRKFLLHPSLQVDNAKWMVAASLVETSRLYARHCAAVEPQWLDGTADHLYKFTYSNEHWSKKRGEVTATKSSLLYGLLIHQQNISYGRINPVEAQELFIRHGLVANQLNSRYGFIDHNLRVIREIEKLEDKLRTSLGMIDDEIFDFYQNKLPPDVIDVPSLEQFIKNGDSLLRINQQEFIAGLTASHEQLNLYPDFLRINDQKIRLKYIFDHHSPEDGLIVQIELHQLSLIESEYFSWLVPGMIRDKVAFLIKALPKGQRLQFNPLQDSITLFLEHCGSQGNFLQKFMIFSEQEKQLKLNYTDLIKIEFPVSLRAHFRIVEQHKTIAGGDDLDQLKLELAPRLDKIVIKHSTDTQIKNITGYIPELSQLLNEVKLGVGGKLTGYQSFIVEKDRSVTLGVVSELIKARKSTFAGWNQLLKLQLKEQYKYFLSKKISGFNEISLALREEYNSEQLSSAIADYIFKVAIGKVLGDRLLYSVEEFTELISQAGKEISVIGIEIAKVLLNTSRLYSQIKKRLGGHDLEEILLQQLDDLIFPDFLNYVSWSFLQNYPRYLQAILIRLDKYSNNRDRDRRLDDEINLVYNKWYNYVDELESKHKIITRDLYDFKYKIEELRISLFAQEIRTLYPVSAKRLLGELESLYLANLA